MLAFVYAVSFVCLAGVLLSLMYKPIVIARIVFIWVLFLFLGFFTHALLLYAAIVAVAYYFRNEEDVSKIFLFLCLLTAMPSQNYDILGLGVWWTSYPVVLAISFLLPLCCKVFITLGPERLRFSSVDLVFFVFIAFQCVLRFRADSALQTNVDMIITMILPYFAITRFVKTEADIECVVAGLMIGIGLLSVLAVAETLLYWRLYPQITYQLNLDVTVYGQAYNERFGLLRTSGGAAMNPLIYAYLVNVSILGICYYVQQGKLQLVRALPFLGVSFIALVFTGSRAGLLCLIIGLAFLFYHSLPRLLRLFAFCAVAAVAAWAIVFVASGGFTALDTTGSFQYRVDLFNNALEAISASPLVGYSNIADSHAMRRSIQGEGIIDLVNTYLIFALTTGLPGLFLFLTVIVMALRALSKSKMLFLSDYKPFFYSIFLCILIYISTASFLGFIAYVFWVLLALCLVCVRVDDALIKEQRSKLQAQT